MPFGCPRVAARVARGDDMGGWRIRSGVPWPGALPGVSLIPLIPADTVPTYPTYPTYLRSVTQALPTYRTYRTVLVL